MKAAPESTGSTVIRRQRGDQVVMETVPLLQPLPSGAWALFTDPEDLTWGSRRIVEKNLKVVRTKAQVTNMAAGPDRGRMAPQSFELSMDEDLLAEMQIRDQELTVAVMLKDWGFDAPLPTPDNLSPIRGIGSRDFTVLSRWAETLYAAAVVVNDPDELDDPKAGPAPSSM